MRRRVVLAAVMMSACAGAGELPGRVSDTAMTLAAPVVLTPVSVPVPVPARESKQFTVDDLWALHDAFMWCLWAPSACDVASIAVEGSPAHADLSRLLEVRRRDGLVASASSTPLRRQVQRLWSGSGSASVQWCWVDDLVLLDVRGGSSAPVIVDDSAVTLDEMWTLSLVGEAWQLTHRLTTRGAQGGTMPCG